MTSDEPIKTLSLKVDALQSELELLTDRIQALEQSLNFNAQPLSTLSARQVLKNLNQAIGRLEPVASGVRPRAAIRAMRIFTTIDHWNQTQDLRNKIPVTAGLLEGVFNINRQAARRFCAQNSVAIDAMHRQHCIDRPNAYNRAAVAQKKSEIAQLYGLAISPISPSSANIGEIGRECATVFGLSEEQMKDFWVNLKQSNH